VNDLHEHKSIHSCNECDQTFSKLFHLQIHRETKCGTIEKETRKTACPDCGKLIPSQKHSTHRFYCPNQKDKFPDEFVVCEVCGEDIKKTSMTGHKLTHDKSQQKIFKCDVCEFVCKVSITLQNHRAEVHNIGEKKVKPWTMHTCSECGKAIRNKNFFLQHMFLEHDIRLPGLEVFTCSYCPKVLCVKRVYLDHLASHTGEKVYACKQCDYTTNWSGNVVKHEKQVHKAKK
jgi:KRAB domain-containing zinc finger protein